MHDVIKIQDDIPKMQLETKTNCLVCTKYILKRIFSEQRPWNNAQNTVFMTWMINCDLDLNNGKVPDFLFGWHFRYFWSSMYCFKTRESYGMRNLSFSQRRWREFKPFGLWDISQSTRLNKSTWRLKLRNGHYQLSSVVNVTVWSVCDILLTATKEENKKRIREEMEDPTEKTHSIKRKKLKNRQKEEI